MLVNGMQRIWPGLRGGRVRRGTVAEEAGAAVGGRHDGRSVPVIVTNNGADDKGVERTPLLS